jgi:hypothetical protein
VQQPLLGFEASRAEINGPDGGAKITAIKLERIEIDHHLSIVCRSIRPFRYSGRPCHRVGGIEQDTVIAPVVVPRHVVERHQFNGDDAEVRKIIKPLSTPA